METKANTIVNQVITSEELRNHFQAHRGLTRRTIEAFPEKELFTHTIGGMRTFAEMISELLSIAAPGIKEMVTGKISPQQENIDFNNSKDTVLKLWDEATLEIDKYWEQIKLEDFHNPVKIFGQYEGTVISSIFYFIDNEIHHRGQGYVYLRSLGIEPPFFWER